MVASLHGHADWRRHGEIRRQVEPFHGQLWRWFLYARRRARLGAGYLFAFLAWDAG